MLAMEQSQRRKKVDKWPVRPTVGLRVPRVVGSSGYGMEEGSKLFQEFFPKVLYSASLRSSKDISHPRRVSFCSCTVALTHITKGTGFLLESSCFSSQPIEVESIKQRDSLSLNSTG